MYFLVTKHQASTINKMPKKKPSWDLTFWNGSSAFVTQIWIVGGHLQNNSGRNFHGSLMHCPLLTVQRVAMELILAVLIWMVCCIVIFNYVKSEQLGCGLYPFKYLHKEPHTHLSTFPWAITCDLLSGYESGVIRASEFRTYHTPLNKQVRIISTL